MFVDAGAAEARADVPIETFLSLEMAEELLPLVVGGNAVFLGRPQRAAAGEEREVRLDGLFRVDGLVAEGHVDVVVPGDDLRDVRWGWRR